MTRSAFSLFEIMVLVSDAGLQFGGLPIVSRGTTTGAGQAPEGATFEWVPPAGIVEKSRWGQRANRPLMQHSLSGLKMITREARRRNAANRH
jgi:hypothetical protein